MAHRNRWFTWVYLLKMVIFHGYVSHNYKPCPFRVMGGKNDIVLPTLLMALTNNHGNWSWVYNDIVIPTLLMIPKSSKSSKSQVLADPSGPSLASGTSVMSCKSFSWWSAKKRFGTSTKTPQFEDVAKSVAVFWFSVDSLILFGVPKF